jgi:hypothetical protein
VAGDGVAGDHQANDDRPGADSRFGGGDQPAADHQSGGEDLVGCRNSARHSASPYSWMRPVGCQNSIRPLTSGFLLARESRDRRRSRRVQNLTHSRSAPHRERNPASAPTPSPGGNNTRPLTPS